LAYLDLTTFSAECALLSPGPDLQRILETTSTINFRQVETLHKRKNKQQKNQLTRHTR